MTAQPLPSQLRKCNLLSLSQTLICWTAHTSYLPSSVWIRKSHLNMKDSITRVSWHNCLMGFTALAINPTLTRSIQTGVSHSQIYHPTGTNYVSRVFVSPVTTLILLFASQRLILSAQLTSSGNALILFLQPLQINILIVTSGCAAFGKKRIVSYKRTLTTQSP